MEPRSLRGWRCPVCPPERLEVLSAVDSPRPGGEYVLLWVQQDVRVECNHALGVAACLANGLQVPLVAAYGLFERYPGATERAFAFLLDGLAELQCGLAARGVPLVVGRAPPPDVVSSLACRACAVVCDMAYTRVTRGWRVQLAKSLACPLLQVETNVVVPVRTASPALEPAGATLRPKLKQLLPRFTQPVPLVSLAHTGHADELLGMLSSAGIARLDVACPEAALSALDVDRSVPRVPSWRGGPRAAMQRLGLFAEKHLCYYRQRRKDPVAQCQSQLSPYLHFGHISTLQVILWLRQHEPGPQTEAWVEELVVRRELARNMVFYAPDGYDEYHSAVPSWAKLTLQAHATDPRPRSFSRRELELGKTDDEAWNAAQHEMVASGHMHNYMRMYWCKQLLLWTSSPQEAFETALWLNDRWELDGRDENAYMGVAWCFGNHDTEFPERPIFGTVRSMTRSGLKGKVDVARYVELVRKKCSAAIGQDPRYGPLLPRPQGLLKFFGAAAGAQPGSLKAPGAPRPQAGGPPAGAAAAKGRRGPGPGLGRSGGPLEVRSPDAAGKRPSAASALSSRLGCVARTPPAAGAASVDLTPPAPRATAAVSCRPAEEAGPTEAKRLRAEACIVIE
uniref:Deoxyribodipyrimidine photo-lyase n=1 Tax=Lingulaulax polyedra TaxID=160621 RepID=A0A516AG38_LINPO|nr:CPD photolyase [Lingulodinium polyedra]